MKIKTFAVAAILSFLCLHCAGVNYKSSKLMSAGEGNLLLQAPQKVPANYTGKLKVWTVSANKIDKKEPQLLAEMDVVNGYGALLTLYPPLGMHTCRFAEPQLKGIDLSIRPCELSKRDVPKTPDDESVITFQHLVKDLESARIRCGAINEKVIFDNNSFLCEKDRPKKNSDGDEFQKLLNEEY